MSTKPGLRRTIALTLAILATSLTGLAQSAASSLIEDYWSWHESADPSPDADPIVLFEAKLRADGMSAPAAASKIEELRKALIADEGEFYNQIYEQGPEATREPSRLLVEAVEGRTPGTALDVGMGQGRNAVFLAKQGWRITGFDPSAVGLSQARVSAEEAGVTIETVQAGAEYFEFGRDKWDLIAILYPIEKVSIHRVHDALKPGGIVVVEAPHKETSPAAHHYESNELLEIFRSFRILKYEDVTAVGDWGLKKMRLVRLVAQKPIR